MYVMSDEERAERARVKEMHARVRSFDRAERYANLAWGFVRGFKYRRIERSHKLQRIDSYGPSDEPVRLWNVWGGQVVRNKEGCFYEHNFPSALKLYELLTVRMKVDVTREAVQGWLNDPDGAIPCPPPRLRPRIQRPTSAKEVAA